jgi:hypothetical protein
MMMMMNTLSWKRHIDQLTSNLGTACYAVTAITEFMFKETLRIIYFFHGYFIMTYGINFLGNSSYSIHILRV